MPHTRPPRYSVPLSTDAQNRARALRVRGPKILSMAALLALAIETGLVHLERRNAEPMPRATS